MSAAYSCCVIKTFGDRDTQILYQTGKSKRFPSDIARRAVRKLEYVDLGTIAHALADRR